MLGDEPSAARALCLNELEDRTVVFTGVLLGWERLIEHVLVTRLQLSSGVTTLQRDVRNCVGCRGCLIEIQLLVGRFRVLVAVVLAVTLLTEHDQILGVVIAAVEGVWRQ